MSAPAPQPPEDEPYRVWHRAASEQLLTAAQWMTSDPLMALQRAREFAQRALARATPMEAMVTRRLLQAVEDVEAEIRGQGAN